MLDHFRCFLQQRVKPISSLISKPCPNTYDMSRKGSTIEASALFLLLSFLLLNESVGFVLQKRSCLSLDIGNHRLSRDVYRRSLVETCLESSSIRVLEKESNESSRSKPVLKPPSIFLNTVGIFLLGYCLKQCTRRWLAVKAGAKFLKAGQPYDDCVISVILFQYSCI